MKFLEKLLQRLKEILNKYALVFDAGSFQTNHKDMEHYTYSWNFSRIYWCYFFDVIRIELAAPGDQILAEIMVYIIVIVTAQCIYYDLLMVMPVMMVDLEIGLFH
jgi:hypothetical protein